MTLFKIYEENRDTLNNDTYWGDVDLPLADLQELYKQSQLALIDGVIAMVEEMLLHERGCGRDKDTFEASYSHGLSDLKDKLLAERKLIEENK